MKTKLVLWGTNAQDERVLIAMELRPEDNRVNVYLFPENIVTEEFSQQMMDVWRDGQPLDFPEGYTQEVMELTVTDSLLPEGVKAERDDLVKRAQSEWHFIVLSSKLNESYQSELGELKDRIEKLEDFDSSLWDELKSFWEKVQVQVRDKNLFRDHADEIRDKTNELFTRMKEMRNRLDDEFKRISRQNQEKFNQLLDELEKKMAEGLRLQSIFDELKDLQRKFRDAKFTRDHRAKVWDRLDSLFKKVKEKRFGKGGNDDRSPMERLQRRFDGLLSAIEKMERSIQRDQDDLNFQNRKIESTDGQLEAQIRQAKIKMIEERIRSKEEKLNEMLQTKVDLESRLESQREKEAKREEQKKLEDARKQAQEKIAQQMKEQAAVMEENAEMLEKAAEAIAEEKTKKEDSLLEAAGIMIGEALEDVVDTFKAVAEVVGDQIEEAVGEIREKLAPEEPEKEDTTPESKPETTIEITQETPAPEPETEETQNEESEEESEEEKAGKE